MLSLAFNAFMSLITKFVEISTEFVGNLKDFLAKMLTLRHKNLIQNTLSAVSSVGTSGYFSEEVSEVKEHNALPGQEVEVRSRRSGLKNTLLESRGLSVHSQLGHDTYTRGRQQG